MTRYINFHLKAFHLQILDQTLRISCQEYDEIVKSQTKHILLDVREKVQFNICALEGSINIPFDSFLKNVQDFKLKNDTSALPTYVICRRGNDSQLAVKILTQAGIDAKDIIGGLVTWSKVVDATFPTY